MRGVTRLATALLTTGCAVLPAAPTTATAELKDGRGEVVGQATFTEVTGGVRVILLAHGLPAGDKAVHIHAVGKCEAPDFASAGAHFNPGNRQHGLLNALGPHAGDLPNIHIGDDGAGRLESFNDRITLAAGPTSLFDGDGSALVVHAGPDDHRTDPSGNSGARIACGVIVQP
jgi:Cu-Zn family superoxide dismutase